MGAQGFTAGAARETGAAVKELLANIILHGYRGRPGGIRITCTAVPEKVTVEISDSAPAYNPLKAQDPAGRLGLAFVRQAADIVSCRHKDHRNILTLVKIRRN